MAFAIVSNAIKLEMLARDNADEVDRALILALAVYRSWLRQLPSGSIEREIEYRRLKRRFPTLLQGAGQQFGATLNQALINEVRPQLEWAENWINRSQLSVAQQQASRLTADAMPPRPAIPGTVEVPSLPRLRSLRDVPRANPAAFQFTQQQVAQIASSAQVVGRSVRRLFAEVKGQSPWMRDVMRLVDQTVRRGFMTGQTMDQVAEQMPSIARQLSARNRAITRTALQDMAQRAHDELWQAQEPAATKPLHRWRYDATLDARTCMICLPWHGRVVTQRTRLPRTPQHPSCRCVIVPLAQGLSSTGPTAGEFLANASDETRRSVMGVNNANRFNTLIAGGLGPDDALRDVVRHPYRRPRRST